MSRIFIQIIFCIITGLFYRYIGVEPVVVVALTFIWVNTMELLANERVRNGRD